MYWFIILFPLLIYPWGFDPYYTMPKFFYLNIFVFSYWLYIIIKRKYKTINLTKPYLEIEIIVIILLCLIGLSTVFSEDIIRSVYGRKYRYEGLLTFISYCSIFLFSYRFMNEKKLDTIIQGMAIISLGVSIYGILQHYLLDFLPRNSSKLNYDRSYAFFDNPNFFGSYLVLIMMISITLYLSAKSKKLSLFYLLTISLAFTSLLFTGTRSGWVGVFCGIVLIFIFVAIKRKDLWKKWVALLLTLILVVLVINTKENEKYTERANTVISDSYRIASNKSTGHEGSSRLFIWERSVTLIKSYFWVGSGPDTLEFVFPATPEEKMQYFGNSKVLVDKAHNEYLHIAVTLGVPALLTYLLLLTVVLRQALRAVKMVKGNEKIFLYGLISTIIGYLAQAFFNISTVPVAPLFWAILGITLAKSTNVINNNALKQNSFEELTEFENKNQTA